MSARIFGKITGKWYATATIVGVVFLLAAVGYFMIDVAYAGRVLPGVAVGSLAIGGSTPLDVERDVRALLSNQPNRLSFIINGSAVTYSLTELGIAIDAEDTISLAIRWGRTGNIVSDLSQRYRSLMGSGRSPVSYDLSSRWELVMDRLGQKIDQPPTDAQVIVDDAHAKAQPAVTGYALDRGRLTKLVGSQISRLDFASVELPVVSYVPRLTTELAQITADKINQSLRVGYKLTALGQIYDLPAAALWSGLELSVQADSFVVRLKGSSLLSYFKDLEQKINRPMQNAVLQMKDDRVAAFRPHQAGAVLRVQDGLELIKTTLLTEQRELELPVNYLEPQTKLSDLNNLGINELVSQGVSNFSGSPANRRHNIQVGASRFDLMLVPPQTTFSFGAALGAVDASTGYLPELVIKGDETIPEYGGGLCQVSTTAFRAVLNGGYPVRERKNHSYRVVYYEPAGSDATIYPPSPDLRFVNDSPGYILMHTYVEGNNLYFDFYGTKMDRQVQLDGPYVYNVTDYPDPVYIETSTIPEGEIKQIDSAHRGADAVLYRYLYDPSGKQISKDVFASHYIPWPAKYLVGAAEAPKVDANLKNIPPESSASEEASIGLTPQI
ncbi:hypothetical protein A2V68_00615 [candidate division Kazan bacterium RBG_13_50_9]|uniref:YoaR-like putative peptidoglycan binding domain-containing protein n=1 Tax=candidate division Kazan bacterium RBG_13_50_9 TaxID=1798535 RepID=A0A1F4NRX6_UNCK3|nr:MAG: hypothetical protein A2V68_00615 [candidate division Kazan bacterium RBG_13_50_9]